MHLSRGLRQERVNQEGCFLPPESTSPLFRSRPRVRLSSATSIFLARGHPKGGGDWARLASKAHRGSLCPVVHSCPTLCDPWTAAGQVSLCTHTHTHTPRAAAICMNEGCGPAYLGLDKAGDERALPTQSQSSSSVTKGRCLPLPKAGGARQPRPRPAPDWRLQKHLVPKEPVSLVSDSCLLGACIYIFSWPLFT